MNPTPTEYLSTVKSLFQKNGDPVRAEGQMKYMRHHFEFYGLKAKEWMALARQIFKDSGIPEGEDLKELVRLYFDDEYREVQYVGLEMIQKRLKKQNRDFIRFLEELITTKSWWDTVDWLTKLVGIHFKKHPELRHPYCEKWIESDDFWLQRTAIICHRFDKAETDIDLVFKLILRRADSKEFFVQKGAGWALREYSKVNGPAVIGFIEKHPELPNLTKREGLKWLKNKGLYS